MASYTTKSGRLTVYEAGNGFYVTDNDRKQTRGCGDGVDQFIDPSDANFDKDEDRDEAVTKRIKRAVEGSESEWLEAYFGR